jgi:hypothetical protein
MVNFVSFPSSGLTSGLEFFHSPFDKLRANGKILNSMAVKIWLGNAYPQALLDVVRYEHKDKPVLFLDTPSGAWQ